MMINILPEHLEIIKVILRKHLPSHAKVWVFGSRTTQKIKKFSDLDLAIDMGQPLSLRLTGDLKEDFSESLLPYRVDIVDWISAKPYFKKIIEPDFMPLEFE